MADKHLSNNPQNLTENDWYYEERGGLLIVHWVLDKNGKRVKADHIKIPWGKLKKSLERKLRADAPA